jgi:hypothetical protein
MMIAKREGFVKVIPSAGVRRLEQLGYAVTLTPKEQGAA